MLLCPVATELLEADVDADELTPTLPLLDSIFDILLCGTTPWKQQVSF